MKSLHSFLITVLSPPAASVQAAVGGISSLPFPYDMREKKKRKSENWGLPKYAV